MCLDCIGFRHKIKTKDVEKMGITREPQLELQDQILMAMLDRKEKHSAYMADGSGNKEKVEFMLADGKQVGLITAYSIVYPSSGFILDIEQHFNNYEKMVHYGYSWAGMTMVDYGQALDILSKGKEELFLLHSDGAESLTLEADEVLEFVANLGKLGIERKAD